MAVTTSSNIAVVASSRGVVVVATSSGGGVGSRRETGSKIQLVSPEGNGINDFSSG